MSLKSGVISDDPRAGIIIGVICKLIPFLSCLYWYSKVNSNIKYILDERNQVVDSLFSPKLPGGEWDLVGVGGEKHLGTFHPREVNPLPSLVLSDRSDRWVRMLWHISGQRVFFMLISSNLPTLQQSSFCPLLAS